MPSSTIKIATGGPSADAVNRAATVLQGGGLVAFPTETVYGLAARADISSAIARLREIKARDTRKAFTVHIADPAVAADFAPRLSGVATRLIKKAWPGPLTLIVPVEDPDAAPIASGLDASTIDDIYYDNTVGLRCPSHPFAREMLRASGGPVVAASANRAGDPPPRSGKEVEKRFAEMFDLLVDAGDTQYARPSTIVRIQGDGYEILRSGVYDERMVSDMATLRILFVCTGNTCRSPMAAALAASIFAERLGCEMLELKDRRILIDSAGTSGGGGGVSAHAVTVMKKRGIAIANHESASFSAAQLRKADHIFAMTGGHRAAILHTAPEVADRVSLVLDDQDVADPVGGSVDVYERCALQIERGLRDRLQEVSV